jgi:GNAT superfamily N-acetyltransferase
MNNQSSYLNLLEESFPGIKNQIIRYENLGFSWGGSGRIFTKEERGIIVSHVGFFECPIIIESTYRRMGALHAICTKATHRGKGYASELIREALQWAEQRCEFTILFTDIPDFYKKFSFQCVPEHRFHLSCNHTKGGKALRTVTSPADDHLFLRCFCEREPISHQLWIEDNGRIASFNMFYATYPVYWSLHYSPWIDGFISFRLENRTLHLFDVIARQLPTLELILEHFSAPIDSIYFYFPPDRFSDLTILEPFRYDDGYLMIHGLFSCVKPFMISPLSRC